MPALHCAHDVLELAPGKGDAVPAGQREHALAPASEKAPALHVTQVLEAAFANEPAVQSVHAVTPTALALGVTEPAEHVVHADAPAAAEKEPAPHHVQTPSGDAKVPAMHGEQTELYTL